MRVLVTGGAGYIGSVSVETLLAAGHAVDVLDDLSTGHRDAVPPGATFHQGRTPTRMPWRSCCRNAASMPSSTAARARSSARSIADPARYYRQNVAGGVALLEAMRTAGVRRLVFSSSAAVYGTPDQSPIPEDAPLRPINPYGESKRVFESALSWYAAAYGLRSVSLRYFNAAGASEANGEDHEPETHLIPNVLRAAEGIGQVTVFGNDYPTPDGTCVRDYIHVEDLARAHLLALEATDPTGRANGTDAGSRDRRSPATSGSAAASACRPCWTRPRRSWGTRSPRPSGHAARATRRRSWPLPTAPASCWVGSRATSRSRT